MSLSFVCEKKQIPALFLMVDTIPQIVSVGFHPAAVDKKLKETYPKAETRIDFANVDCSAISKRGEEKLAEL